MEDQELHADTEAPTFSVLAFRSADFPDEYLGLIVATWLKSLRHSNDWFRAISPKAYYETYSEAIKGILRRPETQIRVAVLTEDNDVAFGYSVYRGNVLDYVFVLSDYRRQGIGKALVPEEIDSFTHMTKLGRDLVKAKKPGWLFNPFI